MKKYVNSASITGKVFGIDTKKVHMLLKSFIMSNEEDESVTKIYEASQDGRMDWQILREQYEDQGIYANGITHTESDLATLYYTGEK